METIVLCTVLLLLVAVSGQQDSFSEVPLSNGVPIAPLHYLVEPGGRNSVCLVLTPSDDVLQLRLDSLNQSLIGGNFSTSGLNHSQFYVAGVVQECQQVQEQLCDQFLIRNTTIITQRGRFSVQYKTSLEDGYIMVTDVDVQYGPINQIVFVGDMTTTPIPIIGGSGGLPFEVYLSGFPLSNSFLVCEANEENPPGFNQSTILTDSSFMSITSCIEAVEQVSSTRPYKFIVDFFGIPVDFSPRMIKVKFGGRCDDDNGISSPLLVVEGFADPISTATDSTLETTSITPKQNFSIIVGVGTPIMVIIIIAVSGITIVVCCCRRKKDPGADMSELDGGGDLPKKIIVESLDIDDTWSSKFARTLAEKKDAQLLDIDITSDDILSVENLIVYILVKRWPLTDQLPLDENATNNSPLGDFMEKMKSSAQWRDKIIVIQLWSDEEDSIKTMHSYRSISLKKEDSHSPLSHTSITSAASRVITLQSSPVDKTTTTSFRSVSEPSKRRVLKGRVEEAPSSLQGKRKYCPHKDTGPAQAESQRTLSSGVESYTSIQLEVLSNNIEKLQAETKKGFDEASGERYHLTSKVEDYILGDSEN